MTGTETQKVYINSGRGSVVEVIRGGAATTTEHRPVVATTFEDGLHLIAKQVRVLDGAIPRPIVYRYRCWIRMAAANASARR
jgi:hypothetical protein